MKVALPPLATAIVPGFMVPCSACATVIVYGLAEKLAVIVCEAAILVKSYYVTMPIDAPSTRTSTVW